MSTNARADAAAETIYVSLTGLPLSMKFDWPFHQSTSGADFWVVHAHVRLEGSGLIAPVAVNMSATVREVFSSLEPKDTEGPIINAIRKEMDRRQLEFVKSGKLVPLQFSSRHYDFKGWLGAALPLLVITGCELALQNADVLIVSAYMSPTEVGMYFAAAKTMSLVMFVHYAVGSAVANRFAALRARGDHEGLKALVRDAVNWTFWPSLAGAILILALGKPLLWLFNPEFTAAYPVMFVLAIGLLVRASMGPAEFVLNMLGEQGLCAVVLVVSAVLDVALSFALVPAFGMLGAAAATSAALVTAALMNYIVARRRLELEISIWASLRSPQA